MGLNHRGCSEQRHALSIWRGSIAPGADLSGLIDAPGLQRPGCFSHLESTPVGDLAGTLGSWTARLVPVVSTAPTTTTGTTRRLDSLRVRFLLKRACCCVSVRS